MTRFIIRRLISSIPVLFGIVLLVFVLVRIIPGDPCTATYGEKATPAVCAAFEARYGLDKPLPEQFLIYAGALAQVYLGSSIRFGRPVAEMLVERLPVTVEDLVSLLFAATIGILLGLVSATRRNSPVDVGTMIIANLGVSTPVFVLGLFLAFVFAVLLKDTPLALPPSGRLSAGVNVIPLSTSWGLQELSGVPRILLDFFSNMYAFNALITGQWAALGDALKHLILPAIAVGTIPLAIIARITRSSLLEVLVAGVPEGSRATRGGSLAERLLTPGNIERVRALDGIAERRGQSLARMAIAWVLRDPRITSALIGARNVGQLDDSPECSTRPASPPRSSPRSTATPPMAASTFGALPRGRSSAGPLPQADRPMEPVRWGIPSAARIGWSKTVPAMASEPMAADLLTI